jgi:hypothetical protein
VEKVEVEKVRTIRQDAVMGRVWRVDVGGIIYHVLNRASFRPGLFK